jgi:hypothetical protein
MEKYGVFFSRFLLSSLAAAYKFYMKSKEFTGRERIHV